MLFNSKYKSVKSVKYPPPKQTAPQKASRKPALGSTLQIYFPKTYIRGLDKQKNIKNKFYRKGEGL